MRYVQAESPENMLHCQRILDISFKKQSKPIIKYLSADNVKLILEQPELSVPEGRRDLVLLCIMYDTGARVQEIVDLIVRNVRLEYPAKIHLTGKGILRSVASIKNSKFASELFSGAEVTNTL